MSVINNKWFQAFVVLLIVSYLVDVHEDAAAATGFFAMLFIFVPKLRKMARLDTIIDVKETPKKTKAKQTPKKTEAKQTPKETEAKVATEEAPEKNEPQVSTKVGADVSAVDLDLNDETIVGLRSQDDWLRYSMARWEDADMNYPDWFEEAQENCQQEAREYFSSIAQKVESEGIWQRDIEREFDLSAYDKFDPKNSDWIDGAVNAYLNRAQAQQSFEKKYKKKLEGESDDKD
tara:strand:- start:848 stop:1546 length:699 start_codon:yes stop_codon:yes gene_type:complete